MNQKQFTPQYMVRMLGSRLALNIYFWVFLFVLKESDIDDQYAYSTPFYDGMIVFFMLFFALLAYVNNFVLLPKLFFRKKRWAYFLSTFILVFITSYIYTFLIKWLPLVFPGLDTLQISIVMSPVDTDLSFTGVIADIQSYFFVMLIWVVLFSLLGLYHHTMSKFKIMEDTINKHRETELSFLKTQINPHFLFNTLNNLYALSLKKSDETPESILKLSSVLRYVLYEASVDLLSFEKEKDMIQAYVDIELLRLEDSPHLQFSITADGLYNIPPLLWLPILENVFKHSRNIDSIEVDFQFSIHKNELRIYCKNKTTEQKTSSKKQTGGIGLSNLRKRLELLYPEKHNLRIHLDENYFIIELTITLPK